MRVVKIVERKRHRDQHPACKDRSPESAAPTGNHACTISDGPLVRAFANLIMFSGESGRMKIQDGELPKPAILELNLPAGTRGSDLLLLLRRLQFFFSAHLAAMSFAVFSIKPFFLRFGREDLLPFPVLENDLISARQNFERLLDLVEMVELDGLGFVEGLEIRRVHEIAHRDV